MADFAQDLEPRTEEEDDARHARPQTGWSSGPEFSGLRPPWDPLSGKPAPWSGSVWDPLTAAAAPNEGRGEMPPSPLLAAVPTARAGAEPAQDGSPRRRPAPAGPAQQRDAQDEQTDRPRPPPRERLAERPSAPGEATDAPELPERERQAQRAAASTEPGEATDRPLDHDQLRLTERPGEKRPDLSAHAGQHEDHAAGGHDAGPSETNAAQQPRTTPSPAQKDRQQDALPGVAKELQDAFGSDARDVHIKPELPAGAAQAGARAVASGDQVMFDPAAVDFGSQEGKHVLASEIAHILQQRKQANPPQRASETKAEQPAPEYDPTHRQALEHEAEQAASQAVQGAAAQVRAGATPPQQQFFGLKDVFDRAARGARTAQQKVRRVTEEIERKGRSGGGQKLGQLGRGAGRAQGGKAGKAGKAGRGPLVQKAGKSGIHVQRPQTGPAPAPAGPQPGQAGQSGTAAHAEPEHHQIGLSGQPEQEAQAPAGPGQAQPGSAGHARHLRSTGEPTTGPASASAQSGKAPGQTRTEDFVPDIRKAERAFPGWTGAQVLDHVRALRQGRGQAAHAEADQRAPLRPLATDVKSLQEWMRRQASEQLPGSEADALHRMLPPDPDKE